MAVLFLKAEVFIWISLGLVLQCSAVERDFFLSDWTNLTWDQARSHCQECFEELVTVTRENIQTITQKITSDHWIGLRKNFYSTQNSSRFWSRWANREPLIFQNWYPGRPISSFSQSCSCSCNCNTETTTTISSFTSATTDAPGATTDAPGVTTGAATGATMDATGATMDATGATMDATGATMDATGATMDATGATMDATGATMDATGATMDATGATMDATGATMDATGATMDAEEFLAETTGAPVAFALTGAGATTCACTCRSASARDWASPWVWDSDARAYVEEACVAILSFGSWVERSCSERLPFICHEERFHGQVNVTQITSESASLNWQRGPSNTSHYDVEVKTDHAALKPFQTGNLTHDLVNLTAGTKYTVKVFPVKCGRRLNPQNITFYTIPYKMENLTVVDVTESSVFLRWDKPAGNVDFYIIEVQGGKQLKCFEETKEVDGLLPGTLHAFTVTAGVQSNTTAPQSEGANITAYTKPGKVSNLTVSDNTDTSMRLTWRRPEGHASAFRVKAMNDNGDVFYEQKVVQTNVIVPDLPMSSRITLKVSALTKNDTLEGEAMTIVDYTAPGSISDLVLETSFESLNASWNAEVGNSTTFRAELLSNEELIQTKNTSKPTVDFDKLSAGTSYTVIVSIYSGDIKGPSLNSTNSTNPLPPDKIDVPSSTKNKITITWTAQKVKPKKKSPEYFVRATSSFWDHTEEASVKGTNTHTFTGLRSGTKYDIEVSTKGRSRKLSKPARVSTCTAAEKRTISLSMMCASVHSLRCDAASTREAVLNKLHDRIRETLGDNVFWILKNVNSTENPTCV